METMSDREHSEDLHRELLQRLTRLETLVEEGFKGVYQRQDKTNGKVYANKDDIRELQDWKLQTKTKVGAIALMVSGIVSVVAFAVNIFL